MHTLHLISAISSATGLIIAAALSTLYWTSIWQIKEYRFDRMRDFFSTRTGKRSLLNLHHAIVIVALIVAAIPLNENATMWVDILITAVTLFVVTILILNRTQPKKWTKKAILIAASSLLLTLITSFLVALYGSIFVSGLTVILFAPILVSAVSISLMPLTARQKDQIIKEAKSKISRLHPTVIGITGSYGKSTTKHFLHAILSQRFSVAMTPKNINVDIGVAQTILSDLTEEHDIFIAEMGAYRPGEIDAICDLVSPIIGILTAINEQHLALFGSLEIIMQTKGELMRALPSSGLAITDADSAACLQVTEQSPARKQFFSTRNVAHVYATDIVPAPGEVRFTLHIGTEFRPARASLHGAQVIPSILAAATAAHHLGMHIDEIVAGISVLEPFAGTMHLQHGIGNMYIIDDSYNSNPIAFIAALDYLRLFTDKRKIVCTPGMNELGPISQREHERVGAAIADVADLLIISRKDSAASIMTGAVNAGFPPEQIIVDEKPARLVQRLQKELAADDIMLIEGRIHPVLQSYLTGKKQN